MTKQHYLLGVLFAILAALFNASIGIFSKNMFSLNLSPSAVAFYKCLIAFLMISVMALFHQRIRERIRSLWRSILPISLCALLGIFVLYFFETFAYQYDLVPVVVFILLGSSAVTTFVCSSVFLKERKGYRQYIGLLLSILGLAVMFLNGQLNSLSMGAIFAGIAGIGYGLFLVLTKKFNLFGDLGLVWYLMGFGTLYLSIPFGFSNSSMLTIESLWLLLPLAILPTIGGFYCTTKALNYIGASRVQLFELSEPVFAAVFAFLFLQELIQGSQWLGGGLILLAIYISEHRSDTGQMGERTCKK